MIKAYVGQYRYNPERRIVELPQRTRPGSSEEVQAWMSLAETASLLDCVPVQKEELVGVTIWVFQDGSKLVIDRAAGSYGRFGILPS